jgi:phospholipid transport system substrate-binding protein
MPIVVLAVAMAVARAADPGGAPPQPTTRQVVEQATHNVLTILRDQGLSHDQKAQKIKQIAYDNISFEVMSRLALGRYWRGLNSDQRTQYVDEFKQLLTRTYGQMIDADKAKDRDIKTLGERQEPDGDWTVQMHIIGITGDDANHEYDKIDFRLRNVQGRPKVIDIVIDNAGLIGNYRSQFQEIMSNGGIDHLLKLLRDKNAAAEK